MFLKVNLQNYTVDVSAADELTTDTETTPEHDFAVIRSTDTSTLRADYDYNYVKLGFVIFVAVFIAACLSRLLFGGKF